MTTVYRLTLWCASRFHGDYAKATYELTGAILCLLMFERSERELAEEIILAGAR